MIRFPPPRLASAGIPRITDTFRMTGHTPDGRALRPLLRPGRAVVVRRHT
nr:hypothetical protein [Streptomyces antibioticus]